MKTILTTILFVLFVSINYAQNDLLPVYPREINFRGVVAYYNGSPFTGLLVEEKTNKKLGEYRNGYKNGVFKEFYPKGQKKAEGKYENGSKVGSHTEWHENGSKKSECKYLNGKINGAYKEWFANKQIKNDYLYNNGIIADGKYTAYLENGQKEKEEVYKNGEKVGGGIYINGQLLEESVLYYPGSKKKKEEGYLKTGRRDGLWKTWYDNGQIGSTGYYKEGSEDSLWTYWYSNGELKKEVKYLKGKIIATLYKNDVDPSESINGKWIDGAYLFRSLSGINEDTAYVMVIMNFAQERDLNSMSANIINQLKSRFEYLGKGKPQMYGKKMLNYSIEFSNPSLFAEYDNGESTKDLGILGTLTIKSGAGYRGKAFISMKMKNEKKGYEFYSDRFGMQTGMYSNKSEAYAVTPSLLQSPINDRIWSVFKVKARIKDVLEADSDGDVETVNVFCDSGMLFQENFKFNVYSENDLNTKLGVLEVSKAARNIIECEVDDGEEAIGKSIRAGNKLLAISAY